MLTAHQWKATLTTLTGALVLASVFAACSSSDPCESGIPEPGAVCAVAGTGQQSFNGDGLDALETDFSLPSAVRVGPSGRVHIADSENQRIRVLTEDGSVETVAGNGVHDPAQLSVPATESPFENPVDFDFDSEGRLVVVSLHDPRILRVEADGMISHLAGIGMYGDSGDDGPALQAMFLEPTGIVIADNGTMFIADGLASRVRAIEPGGNVVAVAGTGEYGYSGDGASALDAEIDYPTALALDPQGRLLIADSVNHAIRRVEQDGTIETIAGNGEKGFAGDGGPATSALLNSPEGLAVADDGTIFVSDTRNHRIRRIGTDGNITTIAGTGESSGDGDGGLAIEADFFSPTRISLHDNLLYVADLNNERVRVVALPADRQ